MERMKKLTQLSYLAAIEHLRGDGGVDALLELLERAKQVWQHVPFEMMTQGLLLHLPLADSQILERPGGMLVDDPSELAGYKIDGMTLSSTPDGRLKFWPGIEEGFDPLKSSGLFYRYVHGGRGKEELFLDGNSWTVPDIGWPCSLGVPTYLRLEACLTRYVKLTRRPDYCAHIAKSWRDAKRIGFLPKPEQHLRRSLHLALHYALEGAVVRQEQRQDESKPVDIEVNWLDMRSGAIIEVKWMGRSAAEDATEWGTSYDHKRAREGLAQVCDYLDRRRGATPNMPVMGYIFVFDALRHNVKVTTESVTRDEGLHFQFEDVVYQPELLARPDVGRPFRCFLEPVID
ncbi:hypothetical protein ACN27J_14850 [Solwaraspora sp. WMMB762]|uniref:hypothetical protein n=1 Tax=Solwaraspora sp. WMMB762 TaxID=3404120 RepID=UPI003B92A3E7